MKTVIKGGRIVNEGKVFKADVVIDGDTIEAILPPGSGKTAPRIIDAAGCYVLPGIIDSHVHFREPGMTDKADIDTESCAAAAGGVTSFFDMPNTAPPTTTLEALGQKQRLASEKSHVNYAFFFGATNDNAQLFAQLDPHRVPGIKLFMGSSTGNMLVDRDEALDRIFRLAAPLPIMTHCEDTAIINRNMETARQGNPDPDVALHPFIRSEEACVASTQKAIALAQKHHTRLHIAHLSTAEELDLLPSPTIQGTASPTSQLPVSRGTASATSQLPAIRGTASPTSQLPVSRDTASAPPPAITAEAVVAHLLFSALDYPHLGTRIKVNPAIKSPVDQFMLRQALTDGRITTVATDHAPHLLSQKEGGCASAASGMPMVQFSLVSMLELVDAGVLSIERMVELMAHNPARLFEVRQRGFLRPGFKADIVVVRPQSRWTVTPDLILSRCGWSPMEGHEYQWRVELTLCNGHAVYNNGVVDRSYIGQPIEFR